MDLVFISVHLHCILSGSGMERIFKQFRGLAILREIERKHSVDAFKNCLVEVSDKLLPVLNNLQCNVQVFADY